MANMHDPLFDFDEQQLRHDFGDFPLVPDCLFDAEWVSRFDSAVLSVMPRIRECYTVAEASGTSAADSDNERSYVELVTVSASKWSLADLETDGGEG